MARACSAPASIWAAAAGLAFLTIALSWPGTLIGDSLKQLSEIRANQLTDWHPPIMAVVWGALGGAPQSMLTLQNLLYWTGMALLAVRLRNEAGPVWGYMLLLVALTPMSIIYLGVVQKDTLLTALFVLAAGVGATAGRWWGAIPAALGMLTRANAVFAFGPFVIDRRGLLSTVALSLALAAAMVPLSRFINVSVLGAERSHVEKSLQLFDIAGIAANSGRDDFIPGLSRCYSPFYWDTLEKDCQGFQKTPDDLSGIWLTAVAQEPLAYARHRLAHFNHNIYFLVPPRQDCVYAPAAHQCGGGRAELFKDAVVRNAFLWPVTWLVVGLLLLFLPLAPLARTLALSGMLYGAAYAVVGVASGFRYFYWTEVAIQLAVVWQIAVTGLPQWRRFMWTVGALWLVGYAFRYGPMIL